MSSGSTSDSGNSGTNGGGGGSTTDPEEGGGTETDPPEETQPEGPGATFVNGVLTVTTATLGENKLTAEMVQQAVGSGSITKVVLPADVEVEDSAFSGISNVTFEVTGDASNVDSSILGGATNVTLDLSGCNGTLFVVTYPAEGCFKDCTALVSLELGAGVTIPDGNDNSSAGVFSGCTNLQTVELADGVTSIGNAAFAGCTSLESIDLNGVTDLGNAAFRGCSNLTTVEGLENLQTIGARAFSGTGISGEIVLTNCASLGSMAFERTTITGIGLPNLTGSIESFSQCKQLQKIFVGGFNGIGGSAFSSCENLKVIYAGVGEEKVRQILTKNYIGLNKEPEYVDYSNWDNTAKETEKLYVVYNVPKNFSFSTAYPQSTQLDGSLEGLMSFFHLG